jgi:seryl-tRNA synthetase
MTLTDDPITAAYQSYLDELTRAGLLIPLGVPGVYGRSGVFEGVVERFERFITRMGAHLKPEVMRFPPVFARKHYCCIDHMENFPNLMGSIHTFKGQDREHMALLRKKAEGADWSRDLEPADVMMVPAACYPLYPTARGTLPKSGRIVDLICFVFRHEPSVDPARMQLFRQREYVCLGTAEQALAHRDYWLKRAEQMLTAVGLDVKAVVANDPFFGRGGKMMAATQKEQTLKFELVAPVATPEKPTAITSCNCHLDHFGQIFGIKTADGKPAHSACIGFGLERIALALFRKHGFDPREWPADVQRELGPC